MADDGEIEGVTLPNAEDSLRDSIMNRTDPSIPVEIRRVIVDQQVILLVWVQKSTNRPHLLKGQGIPYVRAGGSDRRASRFELDEMYSDRDQPNSGLYGQLSQFRFQ